MDGYKFIGMHDGIEDLTSLHLDLLVGLMQFKFKIGILLFEKFDVHLLTLPTATRSNVILFPRGNRLVLGKTFTVV